MGLRNNLINRRALLAGALVFAGLAVETQSPATAAPSQVASATVGASGKFTPITPVRILDTRTGIGTSAGKRIKGVPTAVVVRGLNGVPADATAVLVNVTVVDGAPTTLGAVYQCGSATEIVNVALDSKSPSANSATVPLAADGTICVRVTDSVHVVVDLAGWFGQSGTSGFNAVTPSRLLDTRIGQGAVKAPIPAHGKVVLQVTGRGGVPSGATAAALNLTATETKGSGYITAYPCDQPQPTASNLNFSAGQTIPNLAVVRLAVDGTVCLFSFATTDLIADVSGWFGATGSGFNATAAGVPGDTAFNGGVSHGIAANETLTLNVRGVAGVSPTAKAVAINVVASSLASPGYLTVYPCDQPRPIASNINYTPGEYLIRTAAVMVPVSSSGTVCLYSSALTGVLVSSLGYFE